MTEYRLYFLNKDDHIEARHEFEADHDGDALQIAVVLADACSDVLPSFMLWSGKRCLWEAKSNLQPFVSLSALGFDVQAIVLDHEEQLQHSHFQLSHSRRLLGLSDELKQLQHKGAA